MRLNSPLGVAVDGGAIGKGTTSSRAVTPLNDLELHPLRAFVPDSSSTRPDRD
jgi:hypothetical protein